MNTQFNLEQNQMDWLTDDLFTAMDKELTTQIDNAKAESKMVTTYQEKLDKQKEVLRLEKIRTKLRQNIWLTQDYLASVIA